MSNITRSTGITSHLLDKVWPHLSLLQVQDLHCLMRGQLACSRHRLCAFQSPRPRICDDKTQESRQNRAYSVLDRHPTGIRIARIAVTSMSSKKLREISGKQPSVKLNRNYVCDQGTHARNYPPGMNKAYPRYNLFFFQAEDGIRDVERSRGLGDVYKRQHVYAYMIIHLFSTHLKWCFYVGARGQT